MKKFAIGFGAAILLGAVLLVYFKLSDQALAVIIGVMLGILASIPTSLLLVYALSQKERAALKQIQNHQATPYQPPVVVISGGAQPSISASQLPPSYGMSTPNPRTFTVVGEESIEL
jgi:uncharacterized membrane protein YedE/YeeE